MKPPSEVEVAEAIATLKAAGLSDTADVIRRRAAPRR